VIGRDQQLSRRARFRAGFDPSPMGRIPACEALGIAEGVFLAFASEARPKAKRRVEVRSIRPRERRRLIKTDLSVLFGKGRNRATTSEARQRIFETDDRLFYQEGFRVVGVDRIVVEAEVAKATLYLHFASMPEIPPPAADRKRHHSLPVGVVHLSPE
jgi:hypothetical protein